MEMMRSGFHFGDRTTKTYSLIEWKNMWKIGTKDNSKNFVLQNWQDGGIIVIMDKA